MVNETKRTKKKEILWGDAIARDVFTKLGRIARLAARLPA
jgi:hypothetical protein